MDVRMIEGCAVRVTPRKLSGTLTITVTRGTKTYDLNIPAGLKDVAGNIINAVTKEEEEANNG